MLVLLLVILSSHWARHKREVCSLWMRPVSVPPCIRCLFYLGVWPVSVLPCIWCLFYLGVWPVSVPPCIWYEFYLGVACSVWPVSGLPCIWCLFYFSDLPAVSKRTRRTHNTTRRQRRASLLPDQNAPFCPFSRPSTNTQSYVPLGCIVLFHECSSKPEHSMLSFFKT